MIWLLINPITLLLVYIAYTKSSGVTKKAITIVGGVLDIVVNLSYFTLIFLDIPKELLLTKRIERLKGTYGYRKKLATQLCRLLNYFEWQHCK